MAESVGVDPAMMYGEPLVRQFARLRDPGAGIALMAIAEVDAGELGMQAMELLDTANGWPLLPRWAADIGESKIVAASVMREDVFDDARTVLLESRHPDGETIAVGVLIDRNLGGMAKDVLLVDSIDQLAEVIRDRPDDDADAEVELYLEPIDPAVAAGLIGEAIELTDMTWDPPVGEDYWSGRALALLRADQTPHVVAPDDPPELTQKQRDALRDEFLASPQASGFAPDGDEAWVASLAIDFCVGYAGGDPLRWSPVVVELFMADWVPRKVVTTEGMLACLPAALDAWVRFAGGKRGIPEWAIEVTRSAIGEWTEELVEAASDPTVGGPSKRFLLAAGDAGIDLSDPEALEGFIAGWNARSELELEPGSGPRRDSAAAGNVLEVKIALKGVSKPPVWRRLQLRADTPLDEVHQIIQAAFGWYDSHLHVFESAGEQFGPADPSLDLDLDFADESEFTLGEIAALGGGRVIYTYDFGDDWRHEITVEKWVEPAPDASYPRLLTAKGACPPEDCGGVWGYEELKATRSGSSTEAFDPTAVDAEQIRRRLAEL